jgi:hypothetical protein
MPSGTTVKVFGARIHKVNAAEVLSDAESTISREKERLIAMVASGPSGGWDKSRYDSWADAVVWEVSESIELILDESFRAIIAREIVDFPNECEDDLEIVDPPNECEDVTY